MTDLKIYWSNLTPTRNAWVDDIEDYLNGLQVFYHCEDFQYQRFANELEIVVPVPQADLSQQEVGNYVRIYQDGTPWYYFVMSYKWTSKNSLRLSLSIDSVNTFVGSQIHFSPKTVIERQHKDRYFIDTNYGSNKLIKLFDPENEEIPVNQFRTTDTLVKQSNKSDVNWYLIYDSEVSTADESKPVRCRLLADQALLVYKSSGTTPAQQWWGDDISNDDYYYMDGIDNDFIILGMRLPYRLGNSDTWADRDLELGTEIIIDGPSRLAPVPGGAQVRYYSYWRGIINGFRIIGRNGDDVNVAISIKDVVSGEQPGVRPNGLHWPTTYTTAPDWLTGGVNYDFDYIWVRQLTSYRYSSANNIVIPYSSYIIPEANKVSVQIGSTITRTTIPFGDMDRTDSRLIKIIDLPYAPCEISYDAQTGVYTFPEEWEYESGYMRLKDEYFNKGFESSLDSIDLRTYLTYTITHNPITTDSRLSYLDDPKINTSQFSTYKILYDSFGQDIKWERFVIDSFGQTTPLLALKFKPTNTINSHFAFKMDWDNPSCWQDTSIYRYSDYEDYLLITRNNEETIFSSDYLNYLRNGYNYDKKVKSEQSTMSYAMGALQVVGAAASFVAGAFTGGASVAAGIALSTGAITTFTQAAYQQHTNDEALAQKIKNLQMQSAAAVGSDDIDLLKYYNKNKLHFSVYKPLDFQKAALNDLFFYCGYKHKAMGVPNTTSRVWFNFIQCKPVFVEEEGGEVGAAYNRFWDDIKTRFIAGVTRYHRVSGSYDWAQEKENWEVNLIGYNIADMGSISWSSESFPQYNTTTFSGSWNGPTLNNTTQYIEVKFYDTEADWDNSQPNDVDTAIVQADKTFSIEYRNQGVYAVTFQVVNSTEPQKSSAIRIIYPEI